MKICRMCEKKFKSQNKMLKRLCEAKEIIVCSIECFNNWEANQYEEGKENERNNK